LKKQALITVVIILFVSSSLFIDLGSASAQTAYTLQSSGMIQQEASNRGTLILQITDGYYEIINGTTMQSLIGGANSLGGVNGTSFSAVAQAGENLLENGESLEIAEGYYVSDDTVSLRGNTSLFGQGFATFIQQKANITTHTSLFIISYTANVEIFNMWLDGNRANQIEDGDDMRHGVIPYHASNIWVHDMKITNFTETGYDPAYSHNCVIENSILTGSGDGDIWIDINSTNQTAQNNLCDKIYVVDFGGLMSNVLVANNSASFIEVYQGGQGTPQEIVVSNNTIIATSAIHFLLYVQGCQNVTIKGNIITGFSPASSWVGMQISSGKNHTITNNTVTNCGYGIKSDTYSTSSHLITRNDLRGNTGAIFDNRTKTLDTVIYNLGVDISSWAEIP
jgi:hypothetical protein